MAHEGVRFCGMCGSQLLAATDVATYKQVTVLFADVVRSMDIAAAVDVERLRDIVTELVERAAAVVRRYGGTVVYTGDGVMALFGAPTALEDHAFRGCLAALAIQDEAARLAVAVRRRDDVALQLRVGLNSGRVIAGDLGSGSLGYAAIGAPVGFAQRMESVAPPGGVMLSESTARLVEDDATLGEPEWVRIKGADQPVRARRLLSVRPRDARVGRAEATLVGRRWELAALDAIAERANDRRGGVVNVVGPAGIGKSRMAREAAQLAAGRGVEVFWVFCESHAREIPFGAVTRLLRAGTGIADLDAAAARARLRSYVPDADPTDRLLLDDLLGVADPDVPLPQIDPDARRRRLTSLVNAASLARTVPALFVVEDAQWIDAVSESMLADFLDVTPHTPAMVLITSRPEYDGVLSRLSGAQSITLAPLDDSEAAELLGELLGSDPSVGGLATLIAERAAGNPFFAEEMVRELVQRGALEGERGSYVCRTDVADLSVPATVQAAIAARIDRLHAMPRRTLNAASVIGARFGADLFATLALDPVFDELIDVELIDEVRSAPRAEYAFRHPLIRAVAYESQLKSDRAQWHRRVAAAIEERDPDAAEENAALIAEHLQAAGDLHAAYGWHMRAAARSSGRDLYAARLGWERARQLADALPADDAGRLAMRIAPRTMLCATVGWARAVHESQSRFAELRELCGAAGDKVSLAIAMTGLSTELLYAGRSLEGSRLASEQMALLESIGDPNLTMGLAYLAYANWCDNGEAGEMLRWSQTVVDLANGDPAKGAGFGLGSPLAVALAWRSFARWWLGRPGWRQDVRDAVTMARASTPATLAGVVTWTYASAIQYGVLRPDDVAMRTIEDAVLTAEGSEGIPIRLIKYTLGVALLSRDAQADRQRGLEMMTEARENFLIEGAPFLVPVASLWISRERAVSGDRDAAIPVIREAANDLHQAERLGYGVWATGILVQTLLERGTEGDLTEAREAIDRLALVRAAQASAIRDITLMQLRALYARACGDRDAFHDLAIRYRELAETLGFEGHSAWAAAMID